MGGGPGADGGTSPPGPPTLEGVPRSGARIRVAGLLAGGEWLGPTEVTDHDTGLVCDLLRTEDGASRCLPGGSGRVVFLDAACTEPIFVFPGGACSEGPPDYALYRGPGTCPSREQRVVSRGAYLDPPAVVYGLADAACIESVPGPQETFFVAIPSPASDWVAFDRRVIELTGDLGIEVWDGEDGSALWGTFRSLPDDVACEPESESGVARYTGGPHFCVPSARSGLGGSFFGDDACAQSVARVPECQTGAVIEVLETGSSSCTALTPRRYFALGETLRHDDVTWTLHGTCEPAVPSWLAGFDYRRKGRELPLSGFPAVERAEVGEGRLRSLAWVAGGTIVRTDVGSLRDPESGVRCSRYRLDDGKLHCVPGASAYEPDGPLFADAGCTEPLAQLSYACPGATPPPPFILRYPVLVNECGVFDRVTVYRVEGLHEGPIFSALGGCRPAGMAGGDSWIVHYRLGDEVDPAVFPEIVEGVR
jgi:hypothetical protein